MQLNSFKSKLFFTNEINNTLSELLNQSEHSKLFILVDNHTKKHCLPILNHTLNAITYHLIEIPSGDWNKNNKTLNFVWENLSNLYADRNSVLMNLGGGMVTDLGGFAASTFKRGIKFWNMPTSLLAMVDASTGGKTGINFNGLKNELGSFSFPEFVLIDPIFLDTLDQRNWLSGFAEMIKHALISNKEDLINSFLEGSAKSPELLLQTIYDSVSIKNRFVQQDPDELNVRKALNFGHTIGHAFESSSSETNQPLLHGEAIAMGMICELYLSSMVLNYSEEKMQKWITFIKKLFSEIPPIKDNREALVLKMKSDKKNSSDKINFTLIDQKSEASINNYLSVDTINKALNFFFDLI